MKRTLISLLVIVICISLVSCAGSRRNQCPKERAGKEPRGRYRASIENKTSLIFDPSKYFAGTNTAEIKEGDIVLIAQDAKTGDVVRVCGYNSNLVIPPSTNTTVWQKAIITGIEE